jgi:hypothetical protein
MQKKSSGSKPKVNPLAAKILEQYRNAGKQSGTGVDGGPLGGDETIVKREAPTLPPVHRSGTRGK